MRNKITNVLWGLFFIAIGVAIFGNVVGMWNFELFFDGWWTLFIIIPCFISMIKSGFGVGSTIGFIIGILLLISYYENFDFDLWSLIVPAILILIGLRMLFSNLFRRGPANYEKTININVEGMDQSREQANTTFTSGEKIEYSAIFSSNHVNVKNEPFNGASLNAVFGAIVLDLREAMIDHDIEIAANAIFAGIDIYVPRGVRVKINNVPIFGGVSNKSNASHDPGTPIIYLNSTCMFGGIDIK